MDPADVNQLASKVLRQSNWAHARIEEARALEFRKAWKQAKAITRTSKPGTRIRDQKLSPEQLARVGRIDGL